MNYKKYITILSLKAIAIIKKYIYIYKYHPPNINSGSATFCTRYYFRYAKLISDIFESFEYFKRQKNKIKVDNYSQLSYIRVRHIPASVMEMRENSPVSGKKISPDYTTAIVPFIRKKTNKWCISFEELPVDNEVCHNSSG